MNKKLTAIAVAAALAGASSAAAAGEVAIGGHAHISVDYLSVDLPPNDARSDGNIALSSNSSRINVRGSEDLGNGLQVGFFYEWRVSVDGNESTMGQRNRYGFLKGNWGEVRLGRHDTPAKIVGRKADLFYSTQLGENRNITAQREALSAGFDQRFDNTIVYITPGEMFNAIVAYITDHNQRVAATGDLTDSGGDIDDNNFDAYSVALNLNMGGLYAGLSYEVHNADENAVCQAAGAGNTSCFAADLGTLLNDPDLAGVFANDSESDIRLTVSYKGDETPFKVVGYYEMRDDFGFINGLEQDVFGVGFAWGTDTVFKAQYYVADDLDGINGVDLSNTGAEQISLGVDFKASKQTMFYVTGMLLDNDQNQSYKVTGGHDDTTYTPEDGGEVSGVSFGLRHTF